MKGIEIEYKVYLAMVIICLLKYHILVQKLKII